MRPFSPELQLSTLIVLDQEGRIHAAEAGVETAARFRGLGLAPRVTAAWALAVRGSGRVPIHSTSWTNQASLAVAHKLGLTACAIEWSLSD